VTTYLKESGRKYIHSKSLTKLTAKTDNQFIKKCTYFILNLTSFRILHGLKNIDALFDEIAVTFDDQFLKSIRMSIITPGSP
jgi:hypothetical protein